MIVASSFLTIAGFLLLLAAPGWAAEPWSWVDLLQGTPPPTIAVDTPQSTNSSLMRQPPPSAPPSPWTPTATIAYCREVGIIGGRVEVSLFGTQRSPVEVLDAELRRTPPIAMTTQPGTWTTTVRLLVFALHHKGSFSHQHGPRQVQHTLEALCLKQPALLESALEYPDQIKWSSQGP